MNLDNKIMEEKIKLIHTHVGGEYNKLKNCYAGLIRTGLDALNATERGIYSDCFLLHARNIIDFLCKEKSGDDDVLSCDFTRDKKSVTSKNDFLNSLPEITNEKGKKINLYKRINKQLSHITKSRLNKDEQTNFFDEKNLFKEVFKSINKFLEEYNQKVENDKWKIEDIWQENN